MAVLESKLRLPGTQGAAVHRDNLLYRLASEADRGVGVTAVTAPAGSGKTTLLARRGRQLQSLGVVAGGVLIFDLTTWGWVHIVFGVILLATGIGLWGGRSWARVLGVIAAALNALVQLTIMPAYPFWAALMIALNMVVIYAIVVHGHDAKEA